MRYHVWVTKCDMEKKQWDTEKATEALHSQGRQAAPHTLKNSPMWIWLVNIYIYIYKNDHKPTPATSVVDADSCRCR